MCSSDLVARIAGHGVTYATAKSVAASTVASLSVVPLPAAIAGPAGLLDPLYWNTLVTAVMGSIVEFIYHSLETVFEKNMGEFSFPDLLQDSPYSSNGTNANSSKFQFEHAQAFTVEQRALRDQTRGRGEVVVPFSSKEKTYYKALMEIGRAHV